jgi:2-hydroxychromene-2-carboxylate isomerase
MIGDLERWAERYGVPFRMSPHFSFNTLRMQRTLIAAEQRDPSLAERAALALYRRLWGEEADPVDPATTHAALLEAGASDADAAALLSAPDEPAIKQALLQATEEAVRRGAFGAPAIFVGDELHWGNDRLDLLAWRLATGRIPA